MMDQMKEKMIENYGLQDLVDNIKKEQQDHDKQAALIDLQNSKKSGLQAVENVRQRNERMIELIRKVEIEQKVQREVAMQASSEEQEEQLSRKHYKYQLF